jgi:hypothetical protein
MKRDPIMFFRDVVRSGDDTFIGLLVMILRGDPELRERADRELHTLPRLTPAPATDARLTRELTDRLLPNGNSA